MRRSVIFILLLGTIILFPSCSVKKQAESPRISDGSVLEYIDMYKDLAVSEMRRTKIPASITLAQGMIESDYGRSRLAVEANNHFGIKCHDNWKGATIKHHDDKRNECFRKYPKPEESYYDHSDFLSSTSRYSALFDLKETDYKGWAKGLKKAGYATNPDYANMLIRTIEEYDLWRFDYDKKSAFKANGNPDTLKHVAKNENGKGSIDTTNMKNPENFVVPGRVSRIKVNNRIQYIIVNETDTRESIEKDFSLLKWEIQKYNEMNNDFNLTPGQILYLQPKRDKAEPGKDVHNAARGDSMYTISQKYGIKLRKLYEMNRMNEGEEPKEGDRIWLRGMKPVS
jgi:LysM repeat protein